MTRANAIQDQAAGRIDANRARECKRADDARRILMARNAYQRAFGGIPANDLGDVQRKVVGLIRSDIMTRESPLDCATFLRKEEGIAAKGIITQAVSRARAEQLFSAANEDGEGS